jgi:hypothetical protein
MIVSPPKTQRSADTLDYAAVVSMFCDLCHFRGATVSTMCEMTGDAVQKKGDFGHLRSKIGSAKIEFDGFSNVMAHTSPPAWLRRR